MTGTSHMMMAVSAALPLAGLDPVLLAAAALGAKAPDVDLALGQGFHRKLTHWWPPWFALALLGWWRDTSALWALVLFFALGGLVHLLGDLLTPQGLPLGLHPLRRHRGIGLFSTGSLGEALFTLAWAGVLAGGWFLLRAQGVPVPGLSPV